MGSCVSTAWHHAAGRGCPSRHTKGAAAICQPWGEDVAFLTHSWLVFPVASTNDRCPFLSGPSQMFFINNTPSHCYHLRVASFTLLVNEVCSPQGRPFPAVSSSKGTVGVSARPLDTGPSLTHPVFLVTPALPALPCLLCFD